MTLLRRLGLLMLLDAAAVVLSLWLSFVLRFEGRVPLFYVQLFRALAPSFVLCALPLFFVFGLYHSIWKYSGLRDYLAVPLAVTLASIPFLLCRAFRVATIPYSVLGINWLTCSFLVGGLRAAARLRSEFDHTSHGRSRKRVLILGAGEAGALVARELRTSALRPSHRAIGFIDDDPAKRNRRLDGLRVLGDRHDIPRIVLEHGVDEIVIAMPSAPKSALREIVALCRGTRAALKILPGAHQRLGERAAGGALRDVAIEDLLGRAPVRVDLDEVAAYLQGETVLVTGAGGSIGAELCRRIARFDPEALVLLGRGEHSIYQIHLELGGLHPRLNLIPVIADVRDPDRLRHVFAAHRPTVVFHAAAHKHVPLMEDAPDEAIKNNVFGTWNVAELADEYGTGSFVLVSSDKAVRPSSVMGMTKRAAELTIQEMAGRSKTRFCTVRFGNVLGSRGSVVPLFQRQIARGGPITVTDPRMVRFFMTIQEAADLVIQAGAMGRGGEIFVLDMGEPVRVMDLARDLIRLSGLEPGRDIEIVVTGPRPGEKLWEEVLTAEEGLGATRHERIFIAQPTAVVGMTLATRLAQLRRSLEEPATCAAALLAAIAECGVDTPGGTKR